MGGGMMNTGNGDAGYMNRKMNSNWPTITYFALYGRGSALHFQFEHAGHSYNDEFMQFTEWGARKKAMGGGLPVVTLPDGMQLGESVPTTIYWGKQMGQYPRDPAMAHMMESLLMSYMGVWNAYIGAHQSKDDAKISEAIMNHGPFLDKLEPMLGKMKFICGEKLTVVDFWVGASYCDRMTNPHNPNTKTCQTWAMFLKKYPNFKRYGEDFKKENMDWLSKRPARDI